MKALRTSSAVTSRRGTTLVNIEKRSHMTKRYSYPSGVPGRGPKRSMATASQGYVAGNNLIAEELRTSINRFFAQVAQAATQPNTSAASEGQ